MLFWLWFHFHWSSIYFCNLFFYSFPFNAISSIFGTLYSVLFQTFFQIFFTPANYFSIFRNFIKFLAAAFSVWRKNHFTLCNILSLFIIHFYASPMFYVNTVILIFCFCYCFLYTSGDLCSFCFIMLLNPYSPLILISLYYYCSVLLYCFLSLL